MSLPYYPFSLLLFSLFLLPQPSLAVTCPYDLDSASRMIPPQCYANATDPTATSCCWFVFASYIYAAAAHANLTGVAFLPSATAAACSSNFTDILLSGGLTRPSLLRPNGSCDLAEDPSSLGAGVRPCQFGPLSSLRAAAPATLSNATDVCAAPSVPDLYSNQTACGTCQNAVIAATFSLLNYSDSTEYVACGMAATIGLWSRYFPSPRRFRSYALCMLQVLENVNTLGLPTKSPPPLPPSSTAVSSGKARRNQSRSVKIAATSAVAGLVSLTGIFLFFAICRRRVSLRHLILSDPPATSDQALSEYHRNTVGASPLPTDGLYIFTKSELNQATNGFDDRLLLGEGGAGKVYLGKLPSGQHVAIKRIYREKKIAEFYSEVEVLAKLRHKNLTTLVGYCIENQVHHALVYEYMPGGNLSRALFHGDLTWRRRLQIAVDVAEGLVYLHELPGGAVVHRDVKPTNVLLAESGTAKLSDFGVSRIVPHEGTHVSTEVRGTMGYVDPESFSVGHVSEAADVYSFGVVLLELVTGMHAVVPTPSGGAESIVHMAHCTVRESNGEEDETNIGSIVDPRLGPRWDRSTVGSAFRIAYQCVRPYKNERPRMSEVLSILKAALADLGAREVDVAPSEVPREGNVVPSEPTTEESSTSRTSTPSVQGWSC